MISIRYKLLPVLNALLLARATSAQDTAAAASSTPAECNYDDSLGDYLACNKAKFTTTQLVGAGIGVTLLIFALAFGVLYFVRRRRNKPKSKQSQDDEEKFKRAGDESDDEEEVVTDDDEDDVDDEKADKKIEDRRRARKDGNAVVDDEDDDESRPPPKYSKAATVKDATSSDDNTPPTKRETTPTKAPPAAPGQARQDNDRLKPPSRHAGSSARSSRIGSPTESRSVRNLYPSNPDDQASKRDSLKPPSRPARPHTTLEPQSDTKTRPPLPLQRSSSTKSHKSAAQSQPRTAEERPSVPASRPSRSATVDPVEEELQPPKRPFAPTRSSTVSSTSSTDSTGTSYNDIPLPETPSRGRSAPRASSTYLPTRSSSRMSMSSSRQSSIVPDVPVMPKVSVGKAPVRHSVRASRHPTELRAASVSASVHESDERDRR